MADGPAWPTGPVNPSSPTGVTATNLRAIIVPGVIGVATQSLNLETN